MFITYEILKAKGACEGQALRFKALFPDGCTVTAALCGTHTSEFEWSWAAKNLLSPSARAEYMRARAPAWAGYERACAPAWAEYEQACAPALAEYKRACAEAFGPLAEKE
jgi:hypothetical protein